MKKVFVIFILFFSTLTVLSKEDVFPQEEMLPLPAWSTTPRKRVDRRLELRNIISPPPSGTIYTPAEFAQMEGVIIQVPPTTQNLRLYYAEKIKAIINANAIPYIIADSENRTLWGTTRNDIDQITKDVLVPNGIDPLDVVFIDVKYDANWTRDYGPYHIYVNGIRAIVNNEYYDDRPNDNAFNYKLAQLWNEDIYSTGLSTEGGNFMTDGLGTCWTTTGTLSANINYYGWTKEEIDQVYYDYLNCYNGIYYPEPLPNENTTHIDMFAKVLDQNTIIVGYSSDELGGDPDEISTLDDAAELFASTPKPDGGEWNIVRMPMSFETVNYGFGRTRVHYTHTNSTIVNDHVLVPVYSRGTDEEAIAIYEKLMPNHIIVPINSNAPIISGGAIHCTTMQVPVKNYSRCGNGVIDIDEECDTYFLNGATCESVGDFTGGRLKCGEDCTFDTSECTPYQDKDDSDNEYPDDEITDDTENGDNDYSDDDFETDDSDVFEDDRDANDIWEDDDQDSSDFRERQVGGCSITLMRN